MTPKLIPVHRAVFTELIWIAETNVEYLLDCVRDCRALGSEDGVLQNLKAIRKVNSTLRKAKRELTEGK